MELEQIKAELETASKPKILVLVVRGIVKLIAEFIILKQKVAVLESKVEQLQNR